MFKNTPFSHPGVMIWQTVVPRQATQERSSGCDFYPGQTQVPDTCFFYSYKLPREVWFYQDPDKDQVYWISISAIYDQGLPHGLSSGAGRPGRISSNDDAVRIYMPTDPERWHARTRRVSPS